MEISMKHALEGLSILFGCGILVVLLSAMIESWAGPFPAPDCEDLPRESKWNR